MPRPTLAGAGALLAAPLIVIVGVLVQPTLSDEASRQVAALTDHRGTVITGLSLQTASAMLLIAGTVWLALALVRRTPRLALAGGVLGVFGSLIVLFENGVAATGPSIVRALDHAQATAALHHIHQSAAVSVLEPLSILGDIGLAMLGFAVVRAGAPRWTAAAITIGALGEGAGFGTGTKGVVLVGFAVLFVGLVQAVRTLAARPAQGLTAEMAPSY